MKDYVEQYLEAKRLVIEQNRPTCQSLYQKSVQKWAVQATASDYAGIR